MLLCASDNSMTVSKFGIRSKEGIWPRKTLLEHVYYSIRRNKVVAPISCAYHNRVGVVEHCIANILACVPSLAQDTCLKYWEKYGYDGLFELHAEDRSIFIASLKLKWKSCL